MRIRLRPTTRAVPVLLVAATLGLVGTPAARAELSSAPGASTLSAPAAAPVAPAKNEIVKHAYVPVTMTVPLGTTVTWLNEDAAPHTVTTTKAPVAFDSGSFDKGKSF